MEGLVFFTQFFKVLYIQFIYFFFCPFYNGCTIFGFYYCVFTLNAENPGLFLGFFTLVFVKEIPLERV